MVRVVAGLMQSLKAYSGRRKDRTIKEFNYYCLDNDFTSEKLVFSKAKFAASNVVRVLDFQTPSLTA